MTIRLGIVGLGSQGSCYAQLLAQHKVTNGELTALCSPNPASLNLDSHRGMAKELGVPLFTDYSSFLRSGLIDAVVVVTPHYLHPIQATEAITAGLHVLVEKPLGVYGKAAARLAAVVSKYPNAQVGIFYNQRTNPLYRDLKAMIDAGEFGALRHTTWTITSWWRPDAYYTLSPWRASWDGEGGGVLVNQAPHQLDLWAWLCGLPQRVFARMSFGFRRDIPVEDEVAASVDFGNGASGLFLTGTNDIVGTDRLELLFDAGKVVVNDSKDVTIWRLDGDERQISRQLTSTDAAKVPSGALDLSSHWQIETRSYTSQWGEQHAALMSDFCSAIEFGTPLLAPLSAGLDQLRFANAMHYSAWTGTDVELASLDDEDFLARLNERIAAEQGQPRE